jgi:hypothetical protein
MTFAVVAMWLRTTTPRESAGRCAYSMRKAASGTYIEVVDVRETGNAPLFRSAAGRTGTLTEKSMNRVDAWRMIQRRTAELGSTAKIGCHR